MDTADKTLWNASLSTMWAIGRHTALDDFFLDARRLGFATVELNHQVDSTMLDGIDLDRYAFSSVHEPCPANIPVNTLKSRDWMISAVDEENRTEGVASIKRSIDLAGSMGVSVIVVHAGNVRADWPLEKQLYKLYKAGGSRTPEYLDLKNQLCAERSVLAGPSLEAVKKSMVELLEYAGASGIRLGLENRYHYMDIPILDEMGQLLELAGPEQLGFWYDSGHAQTLDRLGFFPHQAWLEQYGSRIVGVHLHDVVGINDHGAPGEGEVDFMRIAASIPDKAVRTLELRPNTTVEQIKGSLLFLARTG